MPTTPSHTYHQPVMLQEAIEGLRINPKGVYIDLTFGGGSYTKAILERLDDTGRMVAFDQDQDALVQAQTIADKRFAFMLGNFRFLKEFLTSHHLQKVDGIVADLGISSHQLNVASRGFAARLDGPLDMRMNQESTFNALKIINGYSAQKLAMCFKQYGEITNAYPLAKTIVLARQQKSITTTSLLKEAIQKCLPKKQAYKYYAKLFQALRIEVNDELGALKEVLMQTVEALHPQGRLVVLSYHSLEDRLVKNFMKTGNFEGEIVQDIYGNLIRPFHPLHSKPLKPSQEEILRNNRSRSAKLRIAYRNGNLE
ncbi:MAG: 16S rRNA (cytosine(1402)-N(4))-methyltransferase RsmH [Bacteroidota bacterium]